MSFKYTEIGKIPVEWDVKMIQEIGEVVSGGTPKTKEDSYWDGNISWITPKDLSSFTERYIEVGERSITKLGLKNSSAKLLPKGTVLFSSRAPIGYLAIARKELCTNQGFKNIVCDKKYSSNEFLFYVLKAKKNEIESIAGGSTFKEVSGKVVKEFKIPIPPLNEQKAIAHILSTLDDKIEVNKQINKTLENMAQAIFKQWFVDFEFPNEDGEPYKSSGGEMIESELGMIPKGWEVVELCNIVLENRRGFAPSYNKNDIGIPVINQRCIRNHTIIEEAVKYHDNEVKKASEDVYHKPFDVLINSMGVGTLGRVSQVSKVEEERIVHSCITILRANKDIIEPIILGHMIKNLEAVIEMMGTGSTGQTSLNNKNLGMLKVVLPPISIQNEISVLLTKFLNKIDQNNIESNKLVQIRDSLLPKLMSGEIRAPFDEEGEAS